MFYHIMANDYDDWLTILILSTGVSFLIVMCELRDGKFSIEHMNSRKSICNKYTC